MTGEVAAKIKRQLVEFVETFGHSREQAEKMVEERLDGWKSAGWGGISDTAVTSDEAIGSVMAFFKPWPIIVGPGGPKPTPWPGGDGGGGDHGSPTLPSYPTKSGGGSAKPIFLEN